MDALSNYPIDMSDPAQKGRLINHIRAIRGKHRVTIVRHFPNRTNRQNRYYWPCFVIPFGQFLREQGTEYGDHTAHELLKAKFLTREVVNPVTGEVLTYIPSTSTLSTAEFNEYLDKCAYWLADEFGIVVPDPAQYREREHAAGAEVR